MISFLMIIAIVLGLFDVIFILAIFFYFLVIENLLDRKTLRKLGFIPEDDLNFSERILRRLSFGRKATQTK